MTDAPPSAYQQWRLADRAARESEAVLARAWTDFFDRRSKSPPCDELIRAAATLRARADELLQEAIDAGSPPHWS